MSLSLAARRVHWKVGASLTGSVAPNGVQNKNDPNERTENNIPCDVVYLHPNIGLCPG